MFFEEYCIDPVPEYTIGTMKTDENETELSPALKKLTPYASEELNVFISTTLFLASLSEAYGNILDRDQAAGGGLGYNCYSSNKAVDAFKLKIIESRDSQFMYAGDIMNAIDWLCSLSFSDFPDMENTLGGGKGSTDGKKEDEDDDWGWGWLLGDADDWKAIWELNFGDWKMPSWNPLDAVTGAALGAWKELKDQIYMNLVRFFLDAKCRIILASIVAAGAVGIGLGIGLSTYYKNQNKKNKLGEPTPALPSPAELVAKDYGAQNCNDIIQESLGSNNDGDYNENLLQIFQRCGVVLGEGELGLPKQYLDAISTVTSPVELLALLQGSTSTALINFIFSYTKENFKTIYDSKNTASKLSGLFICLGENTTESAIENAEKKIQEKIKDIDYCEQIAGKLQDIMKEKCPNPEVFESTYNKEMGSNIEKYQEIITLLEDECNNIKINLYNNEETGEKGVLSVLNGKMKGEEKLNDNIAESVVGAAKATANVEISQLISGDKFIDSLNIATYNLKDDGLVKGLPEKGEGTQSRYKHDYGWQTTKNLKAPIYFLGGSYNSRIQVQAIADVSSGLFSPLEGYPGFDIYISKPALGENVQSIIQDNQNYDYAENELDLSDNQIIFHGMIDDFFTIHSKDYTGKQMKAVPYGVSTKLLDAPNGFDYSEDRLFGAIFSSLMEKYAQIVGDNWNDVQSDVLNAYNNALVDNFENILNYSEAKKEVTKYFDIADYDDPSDNSSIGPKQKSMMNGLMHSYVRYHLLEYFAMALPFYETFKLKSENMGIEDVKDPIKFYSDAIVEYVAQKIQEEIHQKTGNHEYYNNLINQSYEFVSKKMEYQTKQYLGPRRGLRFYADMNLQSVYDAFTNALEQVPDKYTKSKYSIIKNRFIYDLNKGLEVHTHVGGKPLFQDSKGSLVGETISSNGTELSEKPYSLFGDHQWKFKNGIFFIQNYIYIEYKEISNLAKLNDKTRYKPYLHGVLNREHIDIINDLLESDGFKNKKLSDLFESVKYGSRLCWGVARNGEAHAIEFGSQTVDDLGDIFGEGIGSNFSLYSYKTENSEIINELSEEIFRNYLDKAYNGPNNNANNLPSGMYQSQGVLVNQKAMVCVDGNLCEYLRQTVGNSYKSLFSPDITQNKFHSTKGQVGDIYYGKDYSIVIPIFNKEAEVNMNQSWESFNNDVLSAEDGFNNKVAFQNLMSSLISSDEYKALRDNCFSPKNMIHMNAISGVTSSELYKHPKFKQTKNILLTSMQNIAAAKNN